MSPVEYRTASLPEIGKILEWAAKEGWNPRVDDAGTFHAADPRGFFVATQDGAPVAAISVVNHSDDFAFLGLYICRPDYRGRGIGFSLWAHALAHAGDRTIGLDGVPEQEANYAKSGFVFTDRTRRLQGRVRQGDLRYPMAAVTDFEAIARLDHGANGFSRPNFLKA